VTEQNSRRPPLVGHLVEGFIAGFPGAGFKIPRIIDIDCDNVGCDTQRFNGFRRGGGDLAGTRLEAVVDDDSCHAVAGSGHNETRGHG